MDAIELFRLYSYVAFSAYAARMSFRNHRMFGLGSMVLFCGFSFRMGASLILGWPPSVTGLISTIGVLACWAAMLWDAHSDWRKSRG